MNLELFIKSLSEEEINKLKKLLYPEISTIWEVYDRTCIDEKKDLYFNLSGKEMPLLNKKCENLLRMLGYDGIPYTVANPKIYNRFIPRIERYRSAGKVSIKQIGDWFKWYFEEGYKL